MPVWVSSSMKGLLTSTMSPIVSNELSSVVGFPSRGMCLALLFISVRQKTYCTRRLFVFICFFSIPQNRRNVIAIDHATRKIGTTKTEYLFLNKLDTLFVDEAPDLIDVFWLT